eukprot:154125-Chlamydomonas_euryale.AAC.1
MVQLRSNDLLSNQRFPGCTRAQAERACRGRLCMASKCGRTRMCMCMWTRSRLAGSRCQRRTSKPPCPPRSSRM